ncbi:uncharacterized protein LOC128723562 [Anopheles nili]|uniref:uncharacterized protein LOC128723562 n=1 Tax=Anopheles nili TaxID=185578 RepID=UPI00237B9D1E|nr:uncharacterized protein LOC128723562 [Anopheles nili]
MSDDDAVRSSAPPPLNCENTVPALPDNSSDSLGRSVEPVENGVNVSSEIPNTKSEVTNSTLSTETETTPTPIDHEVIQRKCVQFTTPTPAGTSDDTLRKFIEGDEILDKENPFKIDKQSAFDHFVRPRKQDKIYDKYTTSNGNEIVISDGNVDVTDDADDDNVFITKEEILRQSKFVKTYIKNPDKQLNYDKSVIQKLNAIRAQGRSVRDVVVVECAPLPVMKRPPVPAPRAVYSQNDRNNNNRRTESPQPDRARNPIPAPRVRRDYVDLRVRIGSAETEESLYDSNEVVQNALKFDSRFRKVDFGSQDDIDTIAERTEDSEERIVGANPTEVLPEKRRNGATNKDQADGKKSTFAEDVKKTFSNTVKSADFRKYLQSKGLSLVPAKPKAIESADREKSSVRSNTKDRGPSVTFYNGSQSRPAPLQTKSPSVLARMFQNNRFTRKTSIEPAYTALYARSSNPVQISSQSNGLGQRSQLPVQRFGSFNGSLNKRSITMDVKPKVNVKQLADGREEIACIRRPASVNEVDRPKLRGYFPNRSNSTDDSWKRPVRNAGVQVNFAKSDTNGTGSIARRQVVAVHQRPDSWQPSGLLYKDAGVQKSTVTCQPTQLRPDIRSYGGSSHTVAPLYSEPLREAPIMVQNERESVLLSSGTDSGYHIYEQTPDNLRRGELVYGRIGYLSNAQSNQGIPQDRRSYSSLQHEVMATNGTYGRLRPVYMSSPVSTQSTPIRRGSVTVDREQILDRIYDFCRRSVRNASKTSIHSNQTEPLYQSHTPHGRVVASGSFPLPAQRVHRVQSLNNPRTSVMHYATEKYTKPTMIPSTTNVSNRDKTATLRQNQHERNIENIYAFVTKMQMNQPNTGEKGSRQQRVQAVQTSAASTLRRVTFTKNGSVLSDNGLDEADYINIRGAPDGLLTYGIGSL